MTSMVPRCSEAAEVYERSGSVISCVMRIAVEDQSYVSDLVRFLRERGCMAYVPGDGTTIEVIRPRSFDQETHEIRQLAQAWRTVRAPEVALRFVD
jgi:hypothetical protein